jgi:hypothetical protein
VVGADLGLDQEILSAKLQGLSGERIIKGPAERDKRDSGTRKEGVFLQAK